MSESVVVDHRAVVISDEPVPVVCRFPLFNSLSVNVCHYAFVDICLAALARCCSLLHCWLFTRIVSSASNCGHELCA